MKKVLFSIENYLITYDAKPIYKMAVLLKIYTLYFLRNTDKKVLNTNKNFQIFVSSLWKSTLKMFEIYRRCNGNQAALSI